MLAKDCHDAMQSLAEIKGLSDAKIDKMVEAARKCCSNFGWQTGTAVEKQVWLELYRCSCLSICTSVNHLLCIPCLIQRDSQTVCREQGRSSRSTLELNSLTSCWVVVWSLRLSPRCMESTGDAL